MVLRENMTNKKASILKSGTSGVKYVPHLDNFVLVRIEYLI